MTRLGVILVLASCASRDPGPTRLPPLDLDVPGQSHAGSATSPAAPEPPVAAAPAVPAVPPAPPAPAPPDPATLERLAWPATTTSFELKSAAHVYAAPDLKGEPLGKVIEGTRFAVGESVAGNKKCKVWLAAVPTGWICARYAKPSTRPPEAIGQPIVPEGQLLPQDYYDITEGAARYATEDDVRAGIAYPEPKTKSTYMVTMEEDDVVRIDGEAYVKTSVGLVARADLRRYRPSTFAGVDLIQTPPTAWPFAWVIAPDKKAVKSRATADKKGALAGTFAHRVIVPVLEEVAGFVRVADGAWIERKHLRVARQRPRPAVDDAHQKWIDLDRDEQVMVAYDGDTPVFATLFSSGRRKNDTPPAIYRIRSKSSLTKMSAEERESSHYEVSEVPWATRFRSGLYFHAAYWHDGFGKARSHGCVNLSPLDAKWVYDWTEPTMPDGWNELEVAIAGSMVVLVHDAKHPDPPVFDYEKEARQRVKIRKREKELREAREAAEAAAAEGGDVTTTDDVP